MNKQAKTAQRLESIVNMLIEFSRGNFEIQEEIGEDEDPLNTVIAGLNMVGEELAHYKRELDRNAEFLGNILSSLDEVVYARAILHDDPSASPFTFISGRAQEILGISKEELENEPGKWPKALHPDDVERTSSEISSVLAGKERVLVYRMHHSVLRQYRWIEDRIVPKINAAGIVTELYGSARDITEQRKTTVELEDKSKLISRIITTSDQFFYIVSLDPENTFVNNFSYLSWQIEKIQGSTMDDIRNNPLGWLESIHPDDVHRVKEDNKRMFSTRKPVMRVYRVKHARTGEYVWLEDHVAPVADESGHIAELYGSVRDVTAQKNSELEREQLIKELSNKYNELMQFNYIVSHNLRAPVAHILGLGRLLHADITPEDKETTLEYIQEAAKAMDDLLQDLNVILSTRSMLNEKVEAFLLTDVIRTVFSNLKSEITRSEAEIVTNIQPDAADIVSIKSYVQSALFNLVANAIKYRSPDRTPVISIEAVKREDRTVITVSDNGMGINLGTHGDRIFGLYNRFHLEQEGKGLGLYMTKTQIESLGGQITVDSTEGVGTTFIITL
ncbi:MAG: PAS domain-containing protein [Taibaiella sp.]|nr:PAS domain-containing protein [Taibaiella sp.]